MYAATNVKAATNEDIVAEQLSMPIVSIDTLGNSVTSKESYTDAKVTIYDKNGNIDMNNSDISIRLRGNITLNVAKKSYRFKFPKKENPLELGDGAAKSWNLVANYFDTSLMRNMTAYHLGDMLDGMPYSANSRSVEVYVNGSYQGVYLLFREAVTVRWKEVYEDVKTVPEFVTSEAEKNAVSYERNFTKWNSLGEKVFSEPDEIAELSTHKAHAEYLANWLDERITWLNTYFGQHRTKLA